MRDEGGDENTKEMILLSYQSRYVHVNCGLLCSIMLTWQYDVLCNSQQKKVTSFSHLSLPPFSPLSSYN